MTAKSYLRGHEIEYSNNQWVYSDTKEPTVNNERNCGYCGKQSTKEGHDGCLGTLPGVMNACCGHGQISQMYVQLLDGTVIERSDAQKLLSVLVKYGE